MDLFGLYILPNVYSIAGSHLTSFSFCIAYLNMEPTDGPYSRFVLW